MKLSFKLTPEGKVPHPYIGMLQDELRKHGGKWIEIEVTAGKITNEMHAYYRAVVLPMIYQHYRDNGYQVTEEQVHRNLKKFYGPNEDIGIEEPVWTAKESMADYTKEESVKFMEDIKRGFAEDLYIPDPNQHLEPPSETQQQG